MPENNDNNTPENEPKKTRVDLNTIKRKLDVVLKKIGLFREELHRNRKIAGFLAIPLLIIFFIASINDLKIFFSSFKNNDPVYHSDTYFSFESTGSGRIPESHLYIGLYNTVNQQQPTGKYWLFGQVETGLPYRIYKDNLSNIGDIRSRIDEESMYRKFAEIPMYLLACVEKSNDVGYYLSTRLIIDEKKTRVYEKIKSTGEITKAQASYEFPVDNTQSGVKLFDDGMCEHLVHDSTGEKGRLFYEKAVSVKDLSPLELFSNLHFSVVSTSYYFSSYTSRYPHWKVKFGISQDTSNDFFEKLKQIDVEYSLDGNKFISTSKKSRRSSLYYSAHVSSVSDDKSIYVRFYSPDEGYSDVRKLQLNLIGTAQEKMKKRLLEDSQESSLIFCFSSGCRWGNSIKNYYGVIKGIEYGFQESNLDNTLDFKQLPTTKYTEQASPISQDYIPPFPKEIDGSRPVYLRMTFIDGSSSPVRVIRVKR